MIKLGLYLALAILLIGAAVKSLAFSYDKGVADTSLAYDLEIHELNIEVQKWIDEADDLSMDISGAAIDAEIQIVTEIREIEREVTVYIDRIIEVKPECTDLPELGELFSLQASAANQISDSLTEDPG